MKKIGLLILSIAFLTIALLTSFVGPVSDESSPRYLTGRNFTVPIVSFVFSKLSEYFAFEDRSLLRKASILVQIPIFAIFVWALNSSIEMNLF